jgi:hypothetical protein
MVESFRGSRQPLVAIGNSDVDDVIVTSHKDKLSDFEFFRFFSFSSSHLLLNDEFALLVGHTIDTLNPPFCTHNRLERRT